MISHSSRFLNAEYIYVLYIYRVGSFLSIEINIFICKSLYIQDNSYLFGGKRGRYLHFEDS